jgi:hypothetical protein
MVLMSANFLFGIVLAVVCIVSGCGGVVGVIDDPCQWESRIYAQSRDFIRGDTIAVEDFNYRGDSLPVVVDDSAIYFDVEYRDVGFEPNSNRYSGTTDGNEIANLCRSYKMFGLEKLSTARRSHYGIVFGRIDSTYHAGQYVVMCALCYKESEISKMSHLPWIGGDMFLYVFSYDASGRLLSYARSKSTE